MPCRCPCSSTTSVGIESRSLCSRSSLASGGSRDAYHELRLLVLTLTLRSYFRHWLNWVILYSVLYEFDLMPCVRAIVPQALALVN